MNVWAKYRRWLMAVAAVFLISVASHVSALRNSYVLDDFKLIVGNEFISHWGNASILANPRYLFKPYPLVCGARPLTVFSLMLDHRLWRFNPFGFHLTNILLHAANGVILLFAAFLIFRSLRGSARAPGAGTERLREKLRPMAEARSGLASALREVLLFMAAAIRAPACSRKAADAAAFSSAFLAALIFCLHPVQAEAVNIASFRADLLATLFSLLSLLFFVAASRAGGRRALFLYAGAGAGFILALFSKEMAICIPLVFLLYRLLLAKPRVTRRHVGIIMIFGAAAALFITLFWSSRYEYTGSFSVFPNIQSNVSPFSSLGAYVNTLLHSFLHYARILLAPFGLSVDYQLSVPTDVWNGGNLLSLLLLFACGAVFAYTRDRSLKFGLGFAFLAYLPVSNLIPLINTVTDRYLYLPMAGFSIVVSAVIRGLPEHRISGRFSLRLAVALILLILYGGATLRRNPVFRDIYTLYRNAAEAAPDNVRARYNLAVALTVRERYAEAVREFEAVERLNPLYKRSDVLYLKGECYANSGDPSAAMGCYRKAFIMTPRQDVLLKYAFLLADQGDLAAAISLLEKGTRLFPGVPALYNDLGSYYECIRNHEKAIACFRKAVVLDPKYEMAWFNILLLYDRPGAHGLEWMRDELSRHGWRITECR